MHFMAGWIQDYKTRETRKKNVWAEIVHNEIVGPHFQIT